MPDKDHNIPYDRKWTTSGPNILAGENLSAARAALERGWLCGMHFYYEGGRGGDAVAFAGYSEYLAHIEASRPGDLFLLWSVPFLEKNGELLMAVRGAHPSSGHDAFARGIDKIHQYLRVPGNEVLAAASISGSSPTAVLTDEGGSNWDAFLELLERTNRPSGEIYVLPFTSLDRAARYFLNAKRPNEQGEVPLRGAY